LQAARRKSPRDTRFRNSETCARKPAGFLGEDANAQRKVQKAKRSPQKKSAKSDFIKIKKLQPLQPERETPVPIRNLDGDVLVGVLHEPAQKTDTIVIALHGLMATKDQALIRQTCTEIARAGFAAYRVDFSGNGSSEGRFEDATPKKLLRDTVATVEKFRSYKRIILLGHSLGGLIALVSASRVHVHGLILIAAPTHPERYPELLSAQQNRELASVGFTIITVKRSVGDVPYTITERFVEEMADLHPLDAARDVHCPVLLIRGSGDDIWPPTGKPIPTDDDSALLNALFSREMFLVGGANHNFTTPEHLDILIAKVISWLRNH
jgi:esterase/lipase